MKSEDSHNIAGTDSSLLGTYCVSTLLGMLPTFRKSVKHISLWKTPILLHNAADNYLHPRPSNNRCTYQPSDLSNSTQRTIGFKFFTTGHRFPSYLGNYPHFAIINEQLHYSGYFAVLDIIQKERGPRASRCPRTYQWQFLLYRA